MDQSEVTKAVLKILKKEIGAVSKLIPLDIFKAIEEKVGPEIDIIIEKSGYVKKEKYERLKKITDNLEKRITDLEKDL
jgi:polyhydroxyalkanoate synthesis regulator phasin|tara:strand:+ start:1751 stop:1984 length:234 start_codon:yes stop_codon:yes gene_type:complete